MSSSADARRMLLRDRLLGRWAAEKLELEGRDIDAYSEALADAARDLHGDVFSTIRKDFDKAGVAQTDSDILRVMNDLLIEAGKMMPAASGERVPGAQAFLARKLLSR